MGIPGDHERLKALMSGSVDAAVLGTSFAPTALARLGLTQLLFFGDAMMFPTAGLGIDAAMIDPDGWEVRAVIDAQREGLELIKAQATVAVNAVAALLPEARARTRKDCFATTLRRTTARHPRMLRPSGAAPSRGCRTS